MQVCKEAHEPIAFSTPICPACMIVKHFTEKVGDLKERIEVLEGDLNELEVINA